MSLVLDNLVIPDLPGDLLAEYPYAVIFRSGFQMFVTGMFEAVCSKTPFVWIDDFPYSLSDNVTISRDFLWNANNSAVKYRYNYTTSAWEQQLDDDGTNPVAGGSTIFDDNAYLDLESVDFYSHILWVNHAVYCVSDYSLTNGTYTLTSKEYVPPKFIEESPAVPPIPADVLEKCPYVAMTRSDVYMVTEDAGAMILSTSYQFHASDYPLFYVDMLSLDPSSKANVMTCDTVANLISGTYDPSSETYEWTDVNTTFSNNSPIVMLMGMGFGTMVMVQRLCQVNYKVSEIDIMNSTEEGIVVKDFYEGTGVVEPPERYGANRRFFSKMAHYIRKFGKETKWLHVDEMSSALDDVDDDAGWVGRLMNGGGNTTEITSDATYIDVRPFRFGHQVTKVNFPHATGIGPEAFRNCSNLTEATMAYLYSINERAFWGCSSLAKADLGSLAELPEGQQFYGCSALVTVILRSTVKCMLSNANTFEGTPIASGAGYIYVPSEIIDTYKGDSVWSTYANQFRAIEDYPDICGTA